MKTRITQFIAYAALFCACVLPRVCFAEIFSVSPPRIIFDNLKPGSSSEKSIVVSGNTNGEYSIYTNEGDVVSTWLTQTNATRLPNGKDEIFFKVSVPKDAKYGNYESFFTLISESEPSSFVAARSKTNAGGRVSVQIIVGNKDVEDEKLNWVEVLSATSAKKWGMFKIKGIVKTIFEMQNNGNVEMAPDSIRFEIFDKQNGKKLFERSEKIKAIPAFETKRVVVSFQTSLIDGDYRLTVSTFKKGQYKPDQTKEKNFQVKSTNETLNLFQKMKRIF